MKHFTTSGHTTDSARLLNKHFFKNFAVSIVASAICLSGSFSVYAETEGLEKEDLKFGIDEKNPNPHKTLKDAYITSILKG